LKISRIWSYEYFLYLEILHPAFRYKSSRQRLKNPQRVVVLRLLNPLRVFRQRCCGLSAAIRANSDYFLFYYYFFAQASRTFMSPHLGFYSGMIFLFYNHFIPSGFLHYCIFGINPEKCTTEILRLKILQK